MVVVDVLLGLNLVVLGLCALRGPANRRARALTLKVETTPPPVVVRAHTAPGEAVIIPFRPRRPQPVVSKAMARAMAIHPSAGHGAPNHR